MCMILFNYDSFVPDKYHMPYVNKLKRNFLSYKGWDHRAYSICRLGGAYCARDTEHGYGLHLWRLKFNGESSE